MGDHPVVQVLDICDGVDDATWSKDIGILCEESWGDDTGLVFAGFEMGIWEEEEKGREGVLRKKVWKKLHCVGADNGYVVIVVGVVIRMGNAKSSDAVANILGDLDTDLEAEDVDVGVAGCKVNEETTETTADVCPLRRSSR